MMGRHFIQMGPKSSRFTFAATGSIVGQSASFNAGAVLLGGTGAAAVGGSSRNSGAVLLGGTGQVVLRPAPIARSALFAVASGAASLGGSSTTGSPPPPAATGDWATRIAGPSVVWYHSFDNAAEVDNFRWCGSYGSGNDPLAKGGPLLAPGAHVTLTRVATGGADGGAFMRLTRPAGVAKDDIYWYRQFSPLTGAGNGRGMNDPAANGTIALRTFTPTDGGQQTSFWATQNPAGWYGKPGYEVAGLGPAPGQVAAPFDGNEFYLQLRVRVRADRMTTGNVVNGKFTNFTITAQSHPNQELVTVSAFPTPTSPVGGPYQNNIHNMYEGAFTGYIGDGSNATFGIRNSTGPQWAYSGGWDTLLYHIVPGTNDTNRAGPQVLPFTWDTKIEVWAAHEGETSYTKIWDANFSAIFDDISPFSPYTHNKWAWNAFIAWIYQNGENNATQIVQDYDQIIFSKATIPCPQPPTALETLAATLSVGQVAELTTLNFLSPVDMLEPNVVHPQHLPSASPLTEFGDKMVRHPTQKKIYFVGGARGYFDPAYQLGTTSDDDAGMIIYDEATNTWSRKFGVTVYSGPHSYQQQEIHPTTGDFYYFNAQAPSTDIPRIRRWPASNFDAASVLETPPASPGGPFTGHICWFPEWNGGQGAMIIIDGGNANPGDPAQFYPRVWYRPNGSTTWTEIALSASFPIGKYSNFALYSPVHQCVYFGGGEQGLFGGNPRKVFGRLNANGTVTRLDTTAAVPAAIDLGVFGQSGKQTIDPVTGNLLCFSSPVSGGGDGRVYSFNGSSWTQHGLHGLGNGNQLLCVMCPHPSGVVFIADYRLGASKVFLYRHS